MTSLASFFGRIKRVTEESRTYQLVLPSGPLPVGTFDSVNDSITPSTLGSITTKGNFIIAIPNISRTNLTLTNNGTDDIRYGYEDIINATTIYSILKQGDSIDLENPSFIFAIPLTANPVELNIDEGEG